MTGLLSSVTGPAAAPADGEEGKGKEPAEGEGSTQEESALASFSKQV